MRLRVECYSGHTFAQEPRGLVWEGQRHRVASVEQRWRTPDGPGFWIRTDLGQRFELIYHEAQDHWRIQALPNMDRKDTKQTKVLAFPESTLSPSSSNRQDKEVQD